MKKPKGNDAGAEPAEKPIDIASPTALPSPEVVAAMWDVVIRGHYLANEMRELCGPSLLPSAGAALVLAEVIEEWSTRFGAELEALEACIRVAQDDWTH